MTKGTVATRRPRAAAPAAAAVEAEQEKKKKQMDKTKDVTQEQRLHNWIYFVSVSVGFVIVAFFFFSSNAPSLPAPPVFVSPRCAWEHQSEGFLRLRAEASVATDAEYLPKGVRGFVSVRCKRFFRTISGEVLGVPLNHSTETTLRRTEQLHPIQGTFPSLEADNLAYASCLFEFRLDGALERLPDPGVFSYTTEVYCSGPKL